MIHMKITWVVEPNESPAFNMGRDQIFIDEIGRHAGVFVEQKEGALGDVAPREGYILLSSFHPQLALDSIDPVLRPEIASRTIPLDVSPSRIFSRILEGLGVPAAVDTASYLRWKASDRHSLGAFGPYGLKKVAARVGATCISSHVGNGGEPPAQTDSANYCYLHSSTHYGMTHLLADYLLHLHDDASD
jgi:hypothetical protein